MYSDPSGTQSSGGAPSVDDERQGQRGAGPGPAPDPPEKPKPKPKPKPDAPTPKPLTQAQKDIAAAGELLKLVNDPELLKEVRGTILNEEQARFVLEVFLVASQELNERGLDANSASLLTALASTEVAFGITGASQASSNTPVGNIFSVQPLKEGQPFKGGESKAALATELRRRGIPVEDAKRVNRPISAQDKGKEDKVALRPQATPTPNFRAGAGGGSTRVDGIRLAVEIELDLVQGLDVSGVPEENRADVLLESFGLGASLKKGNLSVGAFATAVRNSGQAGPRNTEESKGFETKLPGASALVSGVLRRFEQAISAQTGPSAGAKGYIQRAIASLPR